MCTDVNECLYKATDCEQDCENTVGSFECSCRQGFNLQPDGKSCEGEQSMHSKYRSMQPSSLYVKCLCNKTH